MMFIENEFSFLFVFYAGVCMYFYILVVLFFLICSVSLRGERDKLPCIILWSHCSTVTVQSVHCADNRAKKLN